MSDKFDSDRLVFELRVETNRGTLCLPAVSEIETDMPDVIFNWVPFMEPTHVKSTQLIVSLLPPEGATCGTLKEQRGLLVPQTPGFIEPLFIGDKEDPDENMIFFDRLEMGCWMIDIPRVVQEWLDKCA